METTMEENVETTTMKSPASEEYYDAYQLYKGIQMIGILPLCTVGLVANTVCVWAWNGLKNNSMATLFQYLGLLDNLFLLVSLILAILHDMDQIQAAQAYVFPMTCLTQSLSVHFTMIIAVFRWFAVAKPLWSRRITQHHVKMVCGGLGAWCVLLTVLLVVLKVMFAFRDLRFVVGAIVVMVIGIILPTIALLGFSVCLFWAICQYERMSPTRPKKTARRMTMAVLSIAACSLLASTVGVAGKILALVLSHRPDIEWCSWHNAFLVFAAGEVLQVLNSSVNFFLYFFFASKFRPLLRHTLCRTSARKNVKKSPPTLRPAGAATEDSPQEPEDNVFGRACNTHSRHNF